MTCFLLVKVTHFGLSDFFKSFVLFCNSCLFFWNLWYRGYQMAKSVYGSIIAKNVLMSQGWISQIPTMSNIGDRTTSLTKLEELKLAFSSLVKLVVRNLKNPAEKVSSYSTDLIHLNLVHSLTFVPVVKPHIILFLKHSRSWYIASTWRKMIWISHQHWCQILRIVPPASPSLKNKYSLFKFGETGIRDGGLSHRKTSAVSF